MSDAARALLGMVSRGEAVLGAALEEFARTVLDADPIARLAIRMLDEHEPRRLARAIELAGAVLDDGAVEELQGASARSVRYALPITRASILAEAEAHKLVVEERAKLITELIESVDDESPEDPAAGKQAWAAELEARIARAECEP